MRDTEAHRRQQDTTAGCVEEAGYLVGDEEDSRVSSVADPLDVAHSSACSILSPTADARVSSQEVTFLGYLAVWTSPQFTLKIEAWQTTTITMLQEATPIESPAGITCGIFVITRQSAVGYTAVKQPRYVLWLSTLKFGSDLRHETCCTMIDYLPQAADCVMSRLLWSKNVQWGTQCATRFIMRKVARQCRSHAYSPLGLIEHLFTQIIRPEGPKVVSKSK